MAIGGLRSTEKVLTHAVDAVGNSTANLPGDPEGTDRLYIELACGQMEAALKQLDIRTTLGQMARKRLGAL